MSLLQGSRPFTILTKYSLQKCWAGNPLGFPSLQKVFWDQTVPMLRNSSSVTIKTTFGQTHKREHESYNIRRGIIRIIPTVQKQHEKIKQTQYLKRNELRELWRHQEEGAGTELRAVLFKLPPHWYDLRTGGKCKFMGPLPPPESEILGMGPTVCLNKLSR